MAWDKHPKPVGKRSRRWGSLRRGSLVIEAVIASALLATAAYGLTRLAQSAATLSQQSDQRLAATLAAENTLERLRNVPDDQLLDKTGEVAKSASQRSKCEVNVSALPFTAGDRDGIHLRVDVSPSKNIRVTLHDWRFTADSDGESNASKTPDASNPTTSHRALTSEVTDA